jgi:bifunctional non-homologous end joining protein LigD
MPQEGLPINWMVDNYEIEIKSPNTVFWTEMKLTKIDLLQYYKAVSSVMLPYFKRRPVTLHYYPRGVDNELQFYKRNITKVPNDSVTLVSYQEKSQDKTISLPIISSKAGLLYFASKGVVEFHLWNAKYPHFNQPDFAVFDLDIDNLNNFNLVLDVALILKEYLSKKALICFCKTTGGTGLHVYVPIINKYSNKQVRLWVKSVGDELSKKYPNKITIKSVGGKTHASNKVNIDYMQNTISRTMVAPYSVRGYKKAPVSTPLLWTEVENGNFLPENFNMNTIPQRIIKMGDIFKDVLKLKQNLPI